ncbi:hypothetical protein MRX96_017039 [Rhipicephalus microplus]
MIVLETNRYARQEARRGWHDLTKGDIQQMTFKRFQAMNSLHFYDNEKIKSKGEEGFDRLAKIRPLVDTLKKFLQEYKPSGRQAIDESMVRFSDDRL